MKPLKTWFFFVAVMTGTLAVTRLASAAQPDFSQGFETDNSGWNVYGGQYDATRVASGTNGITASSGNYYGLAANGPWDHGNGGSAATDWGDGSSADFGNGFTTTIDIYLKYGTTNDTRFDWDTGLNDSSGNYLRDFGFIGGYYNDGMLGNRFVINAGNNFGRDNAYPMDPGHDPFTITNQGWYTFKQTFSNNSGFLLDTLGVYDTATNTLLHTWTLGGDPIANVGGPTLGWIAENEFDFLAIDNSALINTPAAVPEPSTWVMGAMITAALVAEGFRRSSRKRTAATAQQSA